MPLPSAPSCPIDGSSSFAVLPTARAAAAQAASTWAGTGSVVPWDLQRHALGRLGFGAPPGVSDPQFDPDSWWAQQIDLGGRLGPYGGVDGLTAAYRSLTLDAAGTKAWLQSTTGNIYAYDAMNQLSQATLCLQAASPAQLFEVLVDVFSNHLNVTNMVSSVGLTRTTYDRDVIRANVFGTFEAMLLASAKSVAMQSFLGLGSSTAAGPNENYGRELLELHTVGRSAGYSQTDVVNVARALTGRTKDANSVYTFVPANHWVGPLTVLGWSSSNAAAASGEAVGDELVRYLARHPATATAIATKLCVRFVSDQPSDALVQAVANAYLDNGTAILPTVGTIFRSTEFWSSRGTKMRRPLENLLATVRALGLTPVAGDLTKTGSALQWMAASAGQSPLAWPAPNGYPDDAGSWRSNGDIAALWGLHLGLAGKWWPTAFGPFATNSVYGGATPSTVGAALDTISARLLGAPLLSSQRTALLAYLGETDSTPMTASKMRSEFSNVAALILHAPQHAVR